MAIVFGQPSPGAAAGAAIGQAEGIDANREHALRVAALQTRGLPFAPTQRGNAAELDAIAERAREFDLSQGPSLRDQYFADAKANQQEAEFAQEMALLDTKLSWEERRNLQQMEEGMAAVLGDESLSTEEKEEARRLYSQRINPLRTRMARENMQQARLQTQRMEQQAAQTSSLERTRLQFLQMRPEDRFSEYMDPQIERQVRDEFLANNPGETDETIMAVPGYQEAVKREVMRRPGGYLRFWTDPQGRPHIINERREQQDPQARSQEQEQIRTERWVTEIDRDMQREIDRHDEADGPRPAWHTDEALRTQRAQQALERRRALAGRPAQQQGGPSGQPQGDQPSPPLRPGVAMTELRREADQFPNLSEGQRAVLRGQINMLEQMRSQHENMATAPPQVRARYNQLLTELQARFRTLRPAQTTATSFRPSPSSNAGPR